MIRFLRFICLVLSFGLLAVSYFNNSLVWPAFGIFIFGILWCVGLVLRWNWVSLLGLFGSFGVAAFGLILGNSIALLISGALFALLAWDLDGFYFRLLASSPEDDTYTLEKRHIARLALPILSGVVLSVFALTVRLKTSFEWLVFLMLFIFWGIGRVVTRLLSKD
jgi:hypothetical protein